MSFEIPLGATRFNSDSQKLEYWMGSAWMQIKTFSPNLNGGARGLIGARYNTAYHNTVDFGDMLTKTSSAQTCSSGHGGLADDM